MTTAADVLAMLRTHYVPENRPPGCLFMPEIGAPDGRRRADLLVAPTSISGQRDAHLIGHEVKVSRADVMAELRDPTKADPWLQYCTYWYLVVSDPALIDGLEIPEAWGVMAPPSGRRRVSMTILRPAPKLTPAGNLAPALSRVAAYVVNRIETEHRASERTNKYLQQSLDRANRENEELRLSREFGMRDSTHAKRLQRILAAVKERGQNTKIEGLWWYGDINDEDIITALTDHTMLRQASTNMLRELDRTIDEVTTTLKPYERLAGTVKAIKAELNTPSTV